MILVDNNLLIYAYAVELPRHDRARAWLEEQLNGITGVGMAWASLLGFTRIVTNQRLFKHPVSVDQAWSQVNRWLGLQPVWTPEPTDRHQEILARLMPQIGKSDLVSDAHLAALAIEHGLELMTTDRDFARFDGLRWRNPLAS
jgi:toxin-antitoxin system PIN domain toxin